MGTLIFIGDLDHARLKISEGTDVASEQLYDTLLYSQGDPD